MAESYKVWRHYTRNEAFSKKWYSNVERVETTEYGRKAASFWSRFKFDGRKPESSGSRGKLRPLHRGNILLKKRMEDPLIAGYIDKWLNTTLELGDLRGLEHIPLRDPTGPLVVLLDKKKLLPLHLGS